MSLPSPLDEGSVDALLDTGVRGLEYFEKFVPLCASVGSEIEWSYLELCARYDQQRGLDLATLAADADVLGRVVEDARAQTAESERLGCLLEGSWSGQSASAAAADLTQVLACGTERVTAVEQVLGAMREGADVIREVIRDKAQLTAGIDATVVGGVPAEAVATIAKFVVVPIGVGPSIGLVANLDVPVLAEWVPGVADVAGNRDRLDDELLERVRLICRRWIDSVFVVAVTETCSGFVDMCSATDTAVREALTVIAATAEAVDDSPLPATESADAVPRSSDCGPGTERTAPSSVAGSQSVVERGSPRAPDGHVLPVSPTGPAQAGETSGNAVPQPIPSVAEFEEAVDRAVRRAGDDLAARIGAALDDFFDRIGSGSSDDPATEAGEAVPTRGAESGTTPDRDNGSGEALRPGRDPATTPEGPSASEQQSAQLPTQPPARMPVPATDSAERGYLEAALDGHHARVALADDGTLSLQVGGPDGASRRFELRAGPFGLPVVVETEVAPPSITDDPEPPTAEPATPTADRPAEPPAATPQAPAPADPYEPEKVPEREDTPGGDRPPTSVGPECPPAGLPAPESPQAEPGAAYPPTGDAPVHEEPATSESPRAPEHTGARLAEAGPL